jgi:DNA-directed RNA polymerase subunit M/transcription elongation factor TFIIS
MQNNNLENNLENKADNFEIAREKGKQILSLVLKQEQNITIFEKYISTIQTDIKKYKNLIYQTANKIKKNGNIREILKDIKTEKIFWESDIYNSFKNQQQEKDDFIKNPFEVEEGVNTCMKCGSKKTYSYTKQIRSADEGTTVFCICVICKNRWKM